jgi:hypothetical protein
MENPMDFDKWKISNFYHHLCQTKEINHNILSLMMKGWCVEHGSDGDGF